MNKCRSDDFFCLDGERNETKLANYYNELIANLEAAGEWERLGELSNHERSNLYFQAANAIRQLSKERVTINDNMVNKERYERVFCSCLDGNKIRDYFEGTNIRTCSNSCWVKEHCPEGRYLYRDKYTGEIVDPYKVNSHIPTAHEIAVAYDECYDI